MPSSKTHNVLTHLKQRLHLSKHTTPTTTTTTTTMPKIVTIIGATGAQGKGVVAAFINNPAYRVRAVTRSPTSAAAVALAAQGAEIATADLDSPPSLITAFAGSSIIFGVTNFFEPLAAFSDPIKAMDVEVQQGLNLARAAAATPTLEHYIWSTLPNGLALSGGKYLVPHFEGKNRIDAFIRAPEQKALLAKTTFLWVTWYHANYSFPMFTPYFIPTSGTYVQFASYAGDTPISTIGDVGVNLAPFVRAVVEQGDKTRGGAVVKAAVEERGAEELLQLWAEKKGKKAKFVRVAREDFHGLWPLWAEEMGVMMEFWDEVKGGSWDREDGGKVLKAEDLGITGELKGVAEAFEGYEI